MFTREIDPNIISAPRHIQDKHFMRKHGPDAYYGEN